MKRIERGGLRAAPLLWAAALAASLGAAGCQSDPGLTQRIHDLDEVVRTQNAANDDLRASVQASEKALAAAKAENERLKGSDEAFRKAKETLEARLKELEGAFPDAGGDVTVEKTDDGGYRFVVQGEVLFGTGADELTEDGKAALKKVADALKGRKEGVRVEGHTDNVPVAKPETKAKFPLGNLDLSLQRALHVADWLIGEGGIEARRVSCAGFGEHRPRADNGTAEGRKKNRRVEIQVEAP